MSKQISKKYTILLVEDEEALRNVYCSYLQENGFNIIEAKDGEDALEKAFNNADNIDIILLDIMLPKLDGIEVLRRLRKDKRTKNLPVYITTVLASDDTIEIAKNLGANGYIIKDNLTPEDIKNKIVELIN